MRCFAQAFFETLGFEVVEINHLPAEKPGCIHEAGVGGFVQKKDVVFIGNGLQQDRVGKIAVGEQGGRPGVEKSRGFSLQFDVEKMVPHRGS